MPSDTSHRQKRTGIRRNKLHWWAAALVISMILAGCAGPDHSTERLGKPGSKGTTDARVIEGVKPEVAVPPGPPPDDLVVTDLRKGTGSPAKRGSLLTVQFAALRWNGEPFQSSWDDSQFQSFSFRLGADPSSVIPGWERGLLGMRDGGRRQLIVPPTYLYDRDMPPDYLQRSDSVVYVVELLGIGRSAKS